MRSDASFLLRPFRPERSDNFVVLEYTADLLVVRTVEFNRLSAKFHRVCRQARP